MVRFGPEVSWYEADRMAMAFAGPDLPVPEVREVGTTLSGRAYAISVRHHGRFLEDTPVEQASAIAPTLTRLLVALFRVPASPDAPVVWHQAGPPAGSWREYLLAGLVDDPGKTGPRMERRPGRRPGTGRPRGGGRRAGAGPGGGLPGAPGPGPRRSPARQRAGQPGRPPGRGGAVLEVLGARRLPVRRRLVQLLGTVPPGVAAADPLSGLLQAPAVRAEPGALLDAAARHHCYELHIGFTHLGWNVWTGDQANLAATARRLAEVLERGPCL